MKFKSRNISIKTKIFSLFLLFAIVLLAILWFFQVVYLNDFYKYIKMQETEGMLDYIEDIIRTEDDPSQLIESATASSNMAVYVTDSEGNKIYNAEYIPNSQMSSLPKDLFKAFYNRAKDNGGQVVISFKGSHMQTETSQTIVSVNGGTTSDGSTDDESVPPKPEGDASDNGTSALDDGADASDGENGNIDYGTDSETNSQEFGPNAQIGYTIEKKEEVFRQNMGNDLAESVVCVSIITVDSQEYVIMVNSVLTPIDATVDTLKVQLQIISLIIVAIALLMALVVSNLTTKSLIKVNESAKEFGKCNYAVEFNAHDYKEIAQLSDTLNYAARELEKTDKLQKDLIANVSHDLRTPLTMIKAYAEVMRDLPGENTPENVQVIIDETERLTGLVNDMLDLSKLEAGTITLEKDQYNLTESISNVMDRYQKLKEQDGYTIDFIYDSEAFVLADEQKMFQVIYNLVNNSINYAGEDKCVTVRQLIKDGIVRIEVSDNGDGIPQDKLPLVWDRYYKVDKEHKRAVQGTGLGLSIVKNILDLHEAKYGVSSVVGKGSTFWFELPVDEQSEEDEDD